MKMNLLSSIKTLSKDIIRSASTLMNSKSGELPSKFPKDAIDVVAPSLAVIFNRSFKEGIFPDNLKVARPIFVLFIKVKVQNLILTITGLSLFCQ